MLPLLVALVASAEPTTVFVKGEDSTSDKNAGRLEYDLEQALSKKGVPLADLAQRFPPPVETSDEGDKLVAAGKEAYDNLDLDGATQKLTEGALFFVKHPNAANPTKMAEIFFFLGAVGLQNGNKQAGKEFARAALLDPDLKPDPKLVGPDVEKALATAKTEVAARKKSPVHFESTPSGATIELDGKKVGVTPLDGLQLAAGRHFVRISHPGFTQAAKFPEVEFGTPVDVKLELTPLPTYAELLDAARRLIGHAGFDTQKLPPNAVTIGKGVGARFLILVTMKTVRGISTEAEAQVWDTQSGDRLRELKFSNDPESLDKTAGVIKGWIDRPSPVTVVEAQPSSGSGVLNKPWIYVAAGVVLAGAAAGVAVAVTRPEHHFNHVLGLP